MLPFASRPAGGVAEVLADGLSEEITARLSRFSYLRVISHADAERLKGQPSDARAAGARLGARYLLEGRVLCAEGSVRILVRLVDADTGTHLWAENYDRTATDGVFALLDDIANRVVASVANASGVLMRTMALQLRERPVHELTGAELILRYHTYLEQFRPEEHRPEIDIICQPTHGTVARPPRRWVIRRSSWSWWKARASRSGSPAADSAGRSAPDCPTDR